MRTPEQLAWADRGMGVGIMPESALEMLRGDKNKKR